MRYSDEKLSAFIDSELPGMEMDAIRDAIASDMSLVDRLAELAEVDIVLMRAYSSIEERPLPDRIAEMLKSRGEKSGNVITFSRWQKLRTVTRGPVALAASVALFVGLGLGQLIQPAGAPAWQEISAALETLPSGTEHALSGGSLKPRFTYQNHRGEFCRLYDLTGEGQKTQSIACRSGGDWRLLTSVTNYRLDSGGDYRTASGGSPLDPVLDQTIAEGPFDVEREAKVMAEKWLD